ncbi:MAG: hypothetical protein Ta2E_12230 [Mycoplasmoidaceae bacterium]|nr:MAG: hypothetical protein Ta2E_12230 [Mycoplasmoidaceae bacterium]
MIFERGFVSAAVKNLFWVKNERFYNRCTNDISLFQGIPFDNRTNANPNTNLNINPNNNSFLYYVRDVICDRYIDLFNYFIS